ncbi:hypothetical protein KC865_02125 [Candidatus Kaiserbacteria bacterium]|nr:hypothetical protein [Candidatus Kaiserbacteria bacterium]USN92181.1 MAG: hypothetical protein H6782_04890 [Candidatus Nomurabacteria bacterium]
MKESLSLSYKGSQNEQEPKTERRAYDLWKETVEEEKRKNAKVKREGNVLYSDFDPNRGKEVDRKKLAESEELLRKIMEMSRDPNNVEEIEITDVAGYSDNERAPAPNVALAVGDGLIDQQKKIDEARLNEIRDKNRLEELERRREDEVRNKPFRRFFSKLKSWFKPKDERTLSEIMEDEKRESDYIYNNILDKLENDPASLTKFEITSLREEDMKRFVHWKAENMTDFEKKTMQFRNNLALKRSLKGD